MRWIVERSLQARFFVLAVAAAMLLFGARQVRDMPVDTLPEFQPTIVHVQAEALGLSAAEVEQLVTVPLEQDLLTFVPWVAVIRSDSINGLSSIELIFEPGTDLYQARQMVQERLSEATVALPGASKAPQMLQPLSSTNRVMMVRLSSRELSLVDLSVLARWTIRPRLMGAPGVANVAIWGQRERQLQVQVDPQRLRDQGVSLHQVVETTANALWWSPLGFVEASTPGTGGFIDTPNQRLTIQHVLPIRSPADLGQVPIEEEPGVRLADVADVVEGHQLLIGDTVLEDGPGLLLVIEKFPGSNTLEVTRAVENELDVLGPGLSGVEVDTTIYRPATAIKRGLDDLRLAALVSLVFLAALLGIFFFDWRAALIGAAAISLSLAVAVAALYVSGATFNIMLLAGLVIASAVIVDDVFVDMDNVKRRLREQQGEDRSQSSAVTIVDALLEMRGAAVIAVFVILLSVLPVLFLDGEGGEFFPPLALAYAVAVVAAMLVALTVTPVLAVFLLTNGPASRKESALAQRVKQAYAAGLARFVRTPGAPYAALAVIALAGIAAVTQLSQPSLLPELKQRDLLIHLDGSPGTSQPEMARILSAAVAELRFTPGVRNVGAHIGRAITSDQIVGIDSGEIWVSIEADAEYDATVTAVREVVDGFPGLSGEVVNYPEERVREVFGAADRDITVRLYGEDPDVLRAEAEELRQVISGIDGVADPQVELPVEEPTIEIEPDLAAVERHGISPGDVRRTAATLLSSLAVGALFEEQKVFEVVVWSTPETRASLTSIRNLPIDKPDGSYVRLEEVADVRIAANPNVIRREAVSRYMDITADVRGRGTGAVKNDIEQLVHEVEFPLEFHAEVLDADHGLPSAENRGLPFAVAAAMGIFLLLQLAVGSWRMAVLFFVSAPVALAGGALAALVDGGDLTIASYAGFFALLAIVARQCIVLVTQYQHLQGEEGGAISDDLVVRATQQRVAPILMSALAIALALGPLLFIGDIFGHEVLAPMAVVILGGLATTTLFSLFIVPAIYLRVARPSQSDARHPRLDNSRAQIEATSGGGS